MNILNSSKKIISKGINANINGFSYETLTDLSEYYKVIKKNIDHDIIKFRTYKNHFIVTNKGNLFKYMDDYINKDIENGHGCKSPDECYINDEKKIIFIIEKKFQKVNGSTCEKIQTPDFKIWQYSRLFKDYDIVYIYCLSNWFKDNCKAELEYLQYKNVNVFYGDDTYYKRKIVNFMNNYK